jgi:hypothetical protein
MFDSSAALPLVGRLLVRKATKPTASPRWKITLTPIENEELPLLH